MTGNVRRSAAFIAAVLLLVGTAGLWRSSSARADASFDAVAAAYGFDATATNESFPLGLVLEGAGPTAQASLNSLPQGSGFASFPYPGDTLVGLPGLLGSLVPGTPQLPAYPFYARSQLGGQPADVNQPGLALHAEANPTSAQSKAVGGSDSTGYVATARIDHTTDSVTANAVADLNAVSLGALGVLRGVHSEAAATVDSLGKETLTSSLVIAQFDLPALKLTIPTQTPGSFPLPNPIPGLPQLPQPNFPPIPVPFGGTTLVAPQLGFQDGQFTVTLPLLGNRAFAVPAAAVASALKAVGLTVTYQAPQRTPTSVVAAQLTLETVLPALPSNRYFNGPVDVKMTLGRSTATISGATAETAVGDGSTGSSSPSADLGGGTQVAFPGSSGNVGGGFPSTSSEVGSPAIAQAPTAQRTLAAGVPAVRRGPLQSTTRDLYLIIVVAGLIGTAVTQALRLMGVRKRWTF